MREIQQNFRFTSHFVGVFAFIFSLTSLFKQHEGADSQSTIFFSPVEEQGGYRVLALRLASQRIYPQASASLCLCMWCLVEIYVKK